MRHRSVARIVRVLVEPVAFGREPLANSRLFSVATCAGLSLLVRVLPFVTPGRRRDCGISGLGEGVNQLDSARVTRR